jgi:curved DNA-binding protein CbpA
LAHYYHFLGLEPDASPDEVTRAYRQKVAECEPFQFPKGSEERQEAEWMIESINVAFQKILNG